MATPAVGATMKALTFDVFGGPEVLHQTEIATPTVLPGHLLLRTEAIGLNFADVYRRKGTYHLVGKPPYVLGYEAAGVVSAVAEDVSSFSVGDRVAVADVPHSNAEFMLVPVAHAIPLPDDISSQQAAAVMLQGLTAQYLCTDSFPAKRGTLAVVHAAAGGVGQLLTQHIKAAGGTVIGLTSSAEKAAVARAAGADEVLLYSEDWVAAVRSFRRRHAAASDSSGAAAPADGSGCAVPVEGADVAFDSVGATVPDSMRAVRAGGGTVVFYGMAGGDPPLVDPRQLMDESKTLTGGDLWSYLTTAAERRRRAEALFALMRAGAVRLTEPTTFPLERGADAHRFLESRASTGKVLLIPAPPA
jgi:NADPH2:quinone reductase